MALFGTNLIQIRNISAVTGDEADPTSSSTWVDTFSSGGNMFGRAKVFFGSHSVSGTTPTANAIIWGKQGDIIVPLGSPIAYDGTDEIFPTTDLGVVPTTSFYVTLDSITGTSPSFSVKVYVMMYSQDQL